MKISPRNRPHPQIRKLDLGKTPTPTSTVDPAKYLLVNTLHIAILSYFDRKIYTYSGRTAFPATIRAVDSFSNGWQDLF
jgi:hypothetical protein